MHWQHFNFLGEYGFSNKKMSDSVALKGPMLMKSNVLKMWQDSQKVANT